MTDTSIICKHHNITINCYLCKRNGRCIHDINYIVCRDCKYTNMYLDIKVCFNSHCTNEVRNNKYGNFCVDCFTQIHPTDIRSANYLHICNYIEKHLVRLGVLNQFSTQMITHRTEDQTSTFKMYSNSNLNIILKIDSFPLNLFGVYKTNIFLKSMIERNRSTMAPRVVYIRFNHEDCVIDKSKLKTKQLYSVKETLQIHRFWKENEVTGCIEPRSPSEMRHDFESYMTRIIGLSILIESFLMLEPTDMVTIKQLYY